MKVTVSLKKVDILPAKMKAGRARTRTLTMLVERIRLDTDPFVPMKSGDLASHTIASRPSVGRLIYSMPYARAQYYGLPGKSRARHPKATMQWFEVSKRRNRRSWRDAAAEEYARPFGKR
ncbi:MAG: minor capsid protein [Coriobacteriia bacterium]